MPRLNKFHVSKDLHGFISYQNDDAIVADISLAALSITNYKACGLFSVHHAFVFLGQGNSIQYMKGLHPGILDLYRIGLTIDKVRALIRNAGMKSEVVESWQLRPIKNWVDRHLAAGHPVILGSEPHNHWICLGGKTSDGDYVCADSSLYPTILTCSWDVLAFWMTNNPKKPDLQLKYSFEALAVLPGRKMPASRSIVPWIDGVWETWASDPRYAKQWSNLLADRIGVISRGGRSLNQEKKDGNEVSHDRCLYHSLTFSLPDSTVASMPRRYLSKNVWRRALSLGLSKPPCPPSSMVSTYTGTLDFSNAAAKVSVWL
jgi:hypothetical protein